MRLVLTEEMIREIERAVVAVATSAGWGAVAIVIEKGRPVKLRTEESVWLERAKDRPPPSVAETG